MFATWLQNKVRNFATENKIKSLWTERNTNKSVVMDIIMSTLTMPTLTMLTGFITIMNTLTMPTGFITIMSMENLAAGQALLWVQ